MNKLNSPFSIDAARLARVVHILIFLLGAQLNCGRHELDSIVAADAQRKTALKALGSAISDSWSIEDEERTQMLIGLLELDQIGSIPVIWRASLEHNKGLIVKWLESGDNAAGIEIAVPSSDGFSTRRYPVFTDEQEWQQIMKGRIIKHMSFPWEAGIIQMPMEVGTKIAIYDRDGNISEHVTIYRFGFE